MTILEKIEQRKARREVIKTVEEAKLRKKKPEIEKELEKEAIELTKELEITFAEALIYVRNEKEKEQKRKIAQERQSRLAAKGKKILRGLEDWGARANQPPITQSHNIKSESESDLQKANKIKTDKVVPTKSKKNFFEICKEANK